MKKNMMRVLLVAMLAMNLTACGGTKAICDFCGVEKTCTEKSLFGEKIYVCKDCEKDLDKLGINIK